MEAFYIEFDAGVKHSSLPYVAGVEEYAFFVQGTLKMVIGGKEASADIKELVCYNRDKVHDVAERILFICKKLLNFEQYVLVGSTIRSYLSWLKDTGCL